MASLYTEKSSCCGCGACISICPREAIIMNTDLDGFVYPTINNDLCVECGLCKKTCDFQNMSVNGSRSIATYAAVNRNLSILVDSSSGGIFAALASIILKKNGVVFGCAFNSDMEPEHICINNSKDIRKLQGSKYVQSNINNTYAEAKKYLKEDKYVLFTGTPCQVAGLKSYLDEEYNKLITADIICHGVPSTAFFKGYINHLEEKLKGKVIDFKFRDKAKGWSYFISKALYKKDGTLRVKLVSPFTSYYMSYFLKGDIYRESCYQCKYANSRRKGDFTMGDYWGIEKAHPEVESENGVSVLLINSEKGVSLKSELSELLILTESTFVKASEGNIQLSKPTSKSNKREAILKMWREGGFKAVNHEYIRENRKKIFKIRLNMMIFQLVSIIRKKLFRKY